MRRKLGIAGLLLICIALALPWLRSEEHADLDAKARAQAPGQFIALRHGQVHYRVFLERYWIALAVILVFSLFVLIWLKRAIFGRAQTVVIKTADGGGGS